MSVSLIDGHIDDDTPGMTDNEIIKALEHCSADDSWCDDCPYENLCTDTDITKFALDLINRQKAEIERLTAFKSYFDELYGKGLDVANWHENGDLEPFDNFYDDAVKEMVGEG